MKRLPALILALICMFSLAACEGRSGKDLDPTEPKYQFKATILEIHDGYLLVEPAAEASESKSAGKITVSRQNEAPGLDLQVGDAVLITYDGMIMETYPAQLHQVYKIEKLTPGLTEERDPG